MATFHERGARTYNGKLDHVLGWYDPSLMEIEPLFNSKYHQNRLGRWFMIFVSVCIVGDNQFSDRKKE